MSFFVRASFENGWTNSQYFFNVRNFEQNKQVFGKVARKLENSDKIKSALTQNHNS